MREQRDDRDRAAERDPRGQQRQRRGEQRAEHEKQDDQRRSCAETGRAHVGSGRGLRDLPFDLDLEAVPGTGPRGVDEVFRLAARDLGRLLRQRHVREGDPAGARDLRRSRRAVGRCDGRDVTECCDARQHRIDPGAHGRVGDLAVLDRDDNLLAVAGCRRRRVLEKGQRLEALRARKAEAVLIGTADALADAGQPDKGGDPGGDDDAAVREAPSGESSHVGRPFGKS